MSITSPQHFTQHIRFTALLSLSLLTSALFTPQLHAAPSRDARAAINTLLTRYAQPARAHLRSSGGLKGGSWLQATRLKSGEMELLEAREELSFKGQPVDAYHVTRRRFQGEPPYALISLSSYRLSQGEATLEAWRLAEGVYLNNEQGKRLTRRERRAEAKNNPVQEARLALALSDQLMMSLKGGRGRRVSTNERLTDHLPLDNSALHSTRTLFSEGRDERLQLTHLEWRWAPSGPRGAWGLTRELKVVDEGGHSTHQLISEEGRLLVSLASDQLAVVSERVSTPDALKSRGSLLRVRGRVSERELQKALAPARPAFERCSVQHNPHRDRTTHLNFALNINARGALIAVSLEGDRPHKSAPWGDFERCLAQAFTRVSYPTPQGAGARVRYPLVFEP